MKKPLFMRKFENRDNQHRPDNPDGKSIYAEDWNDLITYIRDLKKRIRKLEEIGT